LLLQPYKLLGHKSAKLTINTSYAILKSRRVLGRGGFCVVFKAHLILNGEKHFVALKKAIRRESQPTGYCTETLAQLRNEHSVLLAFAKCSCENLPRLFNTEWTWKDDEPYLISLPIGVPLPFYAKSLSPKIRRDTLYTLLKQLNAGLSAALNLGYCHTDLRSDNVLFVDEKFVIIDWGLACKPDGIFHQYRNGINFYHDDIVEAYTNNEPFEKFQAKYDRFSAKCVAYAFVEKNLPWSNILKEDVSDFKTFKDLRKSCLKIYFAKAIIKKKYEEAT